MQRTVFPSVIGVVACAILAAWAVGMFSPLHTTTNAADDSVPPGAEHVPPAAWEWYSPHPTDIIRSNPHAMFATIFGLAGHEPDEAFALAAKAYEHFFGEDVIAPLDWKRANHVGVFFEAYMVAGYDPLEAIMLAKDAMIWLSGEIPPPRGPEPENMNPDGEECLVYFVWIYYCNSEGQVVRFNEFIGRNCWNDLMLDCELSEVSCPSGCTLFIELQVDPACFDARLPDSCVWIKRGMPTTISCDSMLSCDCITSDCKEVNPVCCPTTEGCHGCPCTDVHNACDVIWPEPKD